jgi:hypothetical protein
MEKKYKLDVETKPEFVVFSINSTLKDYKLIFNLNKITGVKFRRIRDYIKQNNISENEILYPVYHHADSFKSYTLVSAKSDENRLFPFLKQTDYLLLVNGNHPPESLKNFINQVKKTPNIIIVFEIKPEGNTQLVSFLNDMELHLIED